MISNHIANIFKTVNRENRKCGKLIFAELPVDRKLNKDE
jgi:hypothetical protein